MRKRRSHGLDNIDSCVLKSSIDIISLPLTRIINLAIREGKFPSPWKVACVKPLLKKSSPKNKINYRPISLLSVPSIVFEKIIAQQISKYFEKYNLFGLRQYGFRKHKNTINAIISLMTDLQIASENGKVAGCVMFDLSAAFDCIEANILCQKLEIYGFNKRSVSLIESFLNNRRQCVQVGEKRSEVENLPYGSPQGSSLSPLLFLILISDIDEWVEHLKLVGFADDTSGIVCASSVEELKEKTETDVKNVIGFMSSNLLVINPEKTCFILNEKGKEKLEEEIKVQNDIIQSSKNETLLGMKISANLQWKDHCNELKNTLRHRLFIIRQIREALPRKILPSIAEALFNSKVRYGIAAYGKIRLSENDTETGVMKQLQVLQNNMLRLITFKKLQDRIPIHELLKRTNMMSVNQMLAQHMMNEMWSIMYEQSNSDILEIVSKNSNYPTREVCHSKLNIIPQKFARKWGFMNQISSIWNKAPLEIRECTRKNTFKRLVKKWAKTLPI